jgi:hypothetical protein
MSTERESLAALAERLKELGNGPGPDRDERYQDAWRHGVDDARDVLATWLHAGAPAPVGETRDGEPSEVCAMLDHEDCMLPGCACRCHDEVGLRNAIQVARAHVAFERYDQAEDALAEAIGDIDLPASGESAAVSPPANFPQTIGGESAEPDAREVLAFRMTPDEALAVWHVLGMGVDLMDAVNEIPRDAPLFGKRDELVALARRLDHEIHCAPASAVPDEVTCEAHCLEAWEVLRRHGLTFNGGLVQAVKRAVGEDLSGGREPASVRVVLDRLMDALEPMEGGDDMAVDDALAEARRQLAQLPASAVPADGEMLRLAGEALMLATCAFAGEWDWPDALSADELEARWLVRCGRDQTGEGYCHTTREGDALIEAELERVAARLASREETGNV